MARALIAAAEGIELLDTWYYGTRQTTSNKAIESMDDMKGLRMRTPNVPFLIAYAENVGATPAPVAAGTPFVTPAPKPGTPATAQEEEVAHVIQENGIVSRWSGSMMKQFAHTCEPCAVSYMELSCDENQMFTLVKAGPGKWVLLKCLES